MADKFQVMKPLLCRIMDVHTLFDRKDIFILP